MRKRGGSKKARREAAIHRPSRALPYPGFHERTARRTGAHIEKEWGRGKAFVRKGTCSRKGAKDSCPTLNPDTQSALPATKIGNRVARINSRYEWTGFQTRCEPLPTDALRVYSSPMARIGELVRVLAALCFLAYVETALFPPTDPANIRDTFILGFWILAIASLLFRRLDDLPLFSFVAGTSLALTVAGKEGFTANLAFALIACSASIFASGVFRNDLSNRFSYAVGANLGILVLGIRLLVDVHTRNTVWSTHWWIFETQHSSLGEESSYLIFYIMLALGTTGALYWDSLIEWLQKKSRE